MIEEKYVEIKNKEEREDFIKNLEAKGYTIDKKYFNREDIIDGTFPIAVNITEKKIRMMGNVTTAAAAASSGVLINRKTLQ